MIYEPAEDSHLLQKYVKKYAKGKVLDMGTGCGIQAETALKFTKEVLAVDINKECVELVKNKGIKCIQSNLFNNVEGNFDLILFNSPYLPEDKREPEESRISTTGGKKGDEILKRFLKQAKTHLENNGIILVVVSSLTGDVENLFKNEGYHFKLLESENLFFEKLKVYLLSR